LVAGYAAPRSDALRYVRRVVHAGSVALLLALSGDQWITLAGVLTGAIGAVGGFVFAYFNGKAERLHTRTLAISARLHEQRLAAYVEIGKFLEWQYLYVSRVEWWDIGLLVQTPDPPEPPGVDDWTTIMGKAKVSASSPVLEALQEVTNTTYALDHAIATKNAFMQVEGAEEIETTTGMPHWIAVEEARRPAMEAIHEAETRMRDELSAVS
jgi:hypothetical protein